MAGSVRDHARDALMWFPAVLARLGLVDRRKGEEAFDLAVPAMVTGAMRTLLRTAVSRTMRGGLDGAGSNRWASQ